MVPWRIAVNRAWSMAITNRGDDCTAMGSHPGSGPATSPAVRALPWGSAAFGLVIHSLVGGVALASAVAADYKIRCRTGKRRPGRFHRDACAQTSRCLDDHVPHASRGIVALVGPPDEFRLRAHDPRGSGFLRAGDGRAWFQLAHRRWTAGALAFSAGTFLCIALSDLLPELQFHSHDRLKLSVALLTGFALMAATAAIDPVERPTVARAKHASCADGTVAWKDMSGSWK